MPPSAPSAVSVPRRGEILADLVDSDDEEIVEAAEEATAEAEIA